MKLKFLAAGVLAVFSAGAVFAQEAPVKEAAAGEISGEAYFGYYGDLNGDEKTHGFELERVYVNWKKKLSDTLSARVTADVYQSDDVDGDGKSDGRGDFFVKYAYFQYKDSFGTIGTQFQAGLIGNPVLGLVDKMAGMRWLTKNQMDTMKIDNSADLGASFSMNIMKMAEISAYYANGEGYKTISGEAYKGKQYSGLLSLTPLKGLFINAFYKYEKVDEEGTKDSYFGGGIAWSDKMYKAGVNLTSVTDAHKESYGKGLYTDAWVNVNMNDLAGMPITFNGRFGYIMPDEDGADETTTFAFGPGYQFADSLQAALWCTYAKTGDEKSDVNGAIKFELKY